MEKDEFKKRRERLGLTQGGLGKVLGFASNTVSGYETGRLEVPQFMDLVFEALEARHIKTLQTPIGSAQPVPPQTTDGE